MEEKILTIIEEYSKRENPYTVEQRHYDYDKSLKNMEEYYTKLEEVNSQIKIEGSEKQIKWALDIRLQELKNLECVIEGLGKYISNMQHLEMMKTKEQTEERVTRISERTIKLEEKRKEILLLIKEFISETRAWKIIER